MKILALSDSHGQFNRYKPHKLPDADMIIHAGDLTDEGSHDEKGWASAAKWLLAMTERYPGIPKLYIPGNHDFGVGNLTFLEYGWVGINNETWTERCQGVDYRIRGVSMTFPYNAPLLVGRWCNMSVNEALERSVYTFDPVDILVSHGPPLGILDFAYGAHLGSPVLNKIVHRPGAPGLVICGHIHEGAGLHRTVYSEVHNVACQAKLIEFVKEA